MDVKICRVSMKDIKVDGNTITFLNGVESYNKKFHPEYTDPEVDIDGNFALTCTKCSENGAERTLAAIRTICQVGSQLTGVESKSTLVQYPCSHQKPCPCHQQGDASVLARVFPRHFRKGTLCCHPAENSTSRQRPTLCKVSTAQFPQEIRKHLGLLWSCSGLRWIEPGTHPAPCPQLRGIH